MLAPKVINSAADHEAALAAIERLIDEGIRPNTSEAEELQLLTLLVQEYESRAFPRAFLGPVDAILFRMEQQNLAPRDLIPYLGSRSKVSEVLSGKRPLTLSMIRALHEGLGIPAKALLQEPSHAEKSDEEELDWSRFPIREMIARGWVRDSLSAVREFFSQLPTTARPTVFLRRSEHIRSARSMDSFSLIAWTTRVIIRAREMQSLGNYDPDGMNLQFMRELAKRSCSERGPAAARDLLAKCGIPLIIEPHLPYTYLDGAAVLVFSNMPIIGMTIRYDRLDNFWFTLMHEVAHVVLHSGQESTEFIDDLDVDAKDDPKEQEADELAGEALIPRTAWDRSPASRLRSSDAALHLAKALGIHPAIVAGRMRHEWRAFRLLNNLVGHREARCDFADIKWPD
jgi:HTH-type transcriptional regulator/antitoxin HigA